MKKDELSITAGMVLGGLLGVGIFIYIFREVFSLLKTPKKHEGEKSNNLNKKSSTDESERWDEDGGQN